jgi:hypothetical protein
VGATCPGLDRGVRWREGPLWDDLGTYYIRAADRCGAMRDAIFGGAQCPLPMSRDRRAAKVQLFDRFRWVLRSQSSRSCVGAARWPERETVSDDSRGGRLAMMQEVAGYWGTDYDWRRCGARLNALPNFMTEVDGLDIHFIHVRSRHEDALPLIVTHGWPGSIIEQPKIIEPLTDPTTAHGGGAGGLVVLPRPGRGASTAVSPA